MAKFKLTPIRLFFLSLFLALILNFIRLMSEVTMENQLFAVSVYIVGIASFVSIIWLGIRIFQGGKLD